jgi:SM-20-related protein
MHSSYDILINSYLSNQIGIADFFLEEVLCKQLQCEIQLKFDANQFHKAGIGSKNKEQHDSSFRSDEIFWLDRKHENKLENDFLNAMDDFIGYLNANCYTGITHCEFHYAMYEAGSFYGKHLDQFKSNSDRAFSMIHYLNDNWQTEDGGELQVHHPNSLQLINPIYGKTVFFKSSELSHEVLKTNKPRLSITGWLKTGG